MISQEMKRELINALIDQKEIFGDELLTTFSENDYEPLYENDIQPEPAENNVNEDKINYSSSKLFAEEFENARSLDELNRMIADCTKCSLGQTRTKFVFGTGNPNAELMLIGEAPGAEEDKQGIPFVGRAGKLLNDILKAINFEREDVYIANILKCRPPNNRDPLPSERETCIPYLNKQIELINPKIILCLGRIAANALLNKNESLANLRNGDYEYKGIKLMATYHPAALLRNPHWKRGCWEDVKKVRKLYDELTA